MKKLFFIIPLILIVGYFSFHFPDKDITLLGIGKHRHFLFHGSLLPLLLFFLFRWFKGSILFILSTGSSLGVGLHLISDIPQNKSISFYPFCNTLIYNTSIDDRAWLAVNIIVCFLIVFLIAFSKKKAIEIKLYKE